MAIDASMFLIAVGAILTLAVDVEAEGFNVTTIGWIVMIVGAVGALVSLWRLGRSQGGGIEERVVERARL